MRHLLSYTVIPMLYYTRALLYKRRRWAASRRLGWYVSIMYIPAYLQWRGEFSMFVTGLTDLGYRPGESITLMCRSAEGRCDQLGAATNVVCG